MSSTLYVRQQNTWTFITTSGLQSVLPFSSLTHGSRIPQAYIDGIVGLKPGIALTTVASVAANVDNMVYENLDIRSAVVIAANNIVFRNCRFTNNGSYRVVENGVTSTKFNNATLVNCEINGAGADAGIAGYNLTVSRTVFKQCLKDVHANDDVYVIECLMNEHVMPGLGSHAECVLRNGGINLSVIRCYMVYEQPSSAVSSAVSAYEQPNCEGFILKDSYVSGGGYAVYAGGNGGQTNNVKITGNIFGRDIERFSGWAGPIDVTGRDTPGWEFSNNTWGARGTYWQVGDAEAGAAVVI